MRIEVDQCTIKVNLYLCKFFLSQRLLFGETLCYLHYTMLRQWSPCLSSSLTRATCMVLHHTVVVRYSTSIINRTLCHASGHLVVYRECVFYSQAFFTLPSLHLFLRLPLGRQFNFKVSKTSC